MSIGKFIYKRNSEHDISSVGISDSLNPNWYKDTLKSDSIISFALQDRNLWHQGYAGSGVIDARK